MLKWTTGAVTALVLAVAALVAPGATPAQAASSGINDWSCQPSAAHPEPVVLLHGLGANKDINWVVHGPAIRKAGYCVFSLTYGTTHFGPVGGLASMRDSAAQIGEFVDRVRAETGAAKVNLVGHSEGTTTSAYYLKFLGGDTKVKHFVGFGSNFNGTTLHGLMTLGELLGVTDILKSAGCVACKEFSPTSDFTADLNDGGVTVPGPHYTSIVSKYDEVVVPYRSGVLDPAPNVTNITLQDRCRLDFSGHIGMAADPNVSKLILNALDPENAKRFACVPMPFVG